jgi:hypothetical protein
MRRVEAAASARRRVHALASMVVLLARAAAMAQRLPAFAAVARRWADLAYIDDLEAACSGAATGDAT